MYVNPHQQESATHNCIKSFDIGVLLVKGYGLLTVHMYILVLFHPLFRNSTFSSVQFITSPSLHLQLLTVS